MKNDNNKIKYFALIGAAGYIAPRHMKAIKDTGNRLIAAFDPNDSVGILDTYFPDTDFFTVFERFDRHIDKLRREKPTFAVDYISICSPNYLHDSHIRFALHNNADVICEKPLVLNPWNIDGLQALENKTGKKVYSTLQLRLHPAVLALKKEIEAGPQNKKYDVDLTYITSRGKWYFSSWKGSDEKSGGVSTNIGIHFFDMLHFVFGKVLENQLHYKDQYKESGFIEYEKARVRWFLSVDAEDLPLERRAKNMNTYRSLTINNEMREFSEGFTHLHTLIYQNILDGGGFGLEESKTAIETVSNIRNQAPICPVADYHPFLQNRFS